MKKISVLMILVLLTLAGCSLAIGGTKDTTATNTPPPKAVVVVTKAPTATNFPRIGTPTAVPPTPTSAATPTPAATRAAMFDDATLEQLMAGTIKSAGVEAQVSIQDDRATGGERLATIQLVSNYNLDENDLLLKLFVLEVGNAMRTIRAFSEGDMQADLDAARVIVTDKDGNEFGTVTAPMPEIIRFLDGETNVSETLTHLSATGVFASFIENY